MLFKRFVIVAAAILIVPAVYVAFLWYTYIDETVTTGEAYSLKIGDGKKETFQALPKALSDLGVRDLVFFELVVTEDLAEALSTNPNHSIMVQSHLHAIGFKEFSQKDRWDFYIGASYFNSLTLKFCEEKLCEIYRHRKYFELP